VEEEYLQLFESNGLHLPPVYDITNSLEYYTSLLDKMKLDGLMSEPDFRKIYLGDEGGGTLKALQRLQSAGHGRSNDAIIEDQRFTKEDQLLNIALAMYVIAYRNPNPGCEWKKGASEYLFGTYYAQFLFEPRSRDFLMNIAKKTATDCADVALPEYPFQDNSDLWLWDGRRQWINMDVFLVFSPDNMPPVIVQRGGTCYIAAASMLVTHLLKRLYPNEPWRVLTFHDVVLQTFVEDDMLRRVCLDKGGQSHETFDLISLNVTAVPMIVNTKSGEDIYDALKEYGPALMEGAFISDDIHATSCGSQQRSFSGEVQADGSSERHAMLIVGARKDRSGVWWFLLQNWWKDAHFIEVDLQRLQSMMIRFNGKPLPIRFYDGEIHLEPYSTTSSNSARLDYAADGGCERVNHGFPYHPRW
jgi:hypothetical protein